MVEVRCKNCGGLNHFEAFSGEVECEYCSVLIELNDERAKFINLYRKADDAWNNQDFDEALKLYEEIVDADATQAEAHWSAALCRYGVSYVTDPYRGEKIPTCNRINRTSILADKNYVAAMKYASARTREQYEARAKEIDRISQEFLKIVDQEEPYDVFISYKNRDESGKRTLDSQVAKKLYLFLKDKGIKVFFAEETLKAVGGNMFEPYIFAALTSAKVMVLFGSCKENVQATWVKNEWKRYLTLAAEDPAKTLIPAYIGDFYSAMPMELSSIQGYDAMSPVFNEEIAEFVKIKLASIKKTGTGKEVNLAERYASQEKVEKMVKKLDCDPELAVSVLIQVQGNVERAIDFISNDSEYKRSRWECSECKTVNTHDACRECGVTKEQSAKLTRQREEIKKREQANSAEHKRAVAARNKKIFKILGGIAAVAVVVVLAIVLIGPIIKDNAPAEQIYTPEIVQTYSGTYRTGSVEGTAIVTIASCDESGKVAGSFEFIVDNVYGKYEITGQIADKKNNGDLTITFTPGEWVIQPDNFTPLESMTVKISDEYQSFVCSQYGMNWIAGENEEYTIKTADDLKKLVGSGAAYQLKNDIDLAGVNWTPIEGFTGTLFGNGFTIKNLTIESSSSNVGLFSVLQGTVMDLKIENANVTVSGRNENVGILCGNLEGLATKVSVSGVVDASKCNNVGGVFGYAKKHINGDLVLSTLTNNASVSGLNYVGGVAGYLFGSYAYVEVDTFVNTGAVTAEEDYAGGVIGYIGIEDFDPVKVYDCENTGAVKGRYYVGGLVGYAKAREFNGSMIENSTCKAAITAEAYVGCIAGKLESIPVNNCKNEGSTLTATGSVTVDGKRCAFVGGYVGSGSDVSNCVNEVPIQYTGGGSYVGGVIGYAFVSISPDYLTLKNVGNNAPVSGADYVGGIAGYLYSEYVTLQIEAAVNAADVTATGDYAGGIAGFCRAADYDGYVYIYDSENSGNVKGQTYVGGIVGYGRAVYDGSVISGCSSSGKVSGKSKTGTIAGELEVIVIQ